MLLSPLPHLGKNLTCLALQPRCELMSIRNDDWLIGDRMNYAKDTLSPDQLLLDPNNYRFHDLRGYKEVKQRSRYAEVGVQERALTLLETTTAFDLQSLKDSIRTNGYIPVEQIVVVPFEDQANADQAEKQVSTTQQEAKTDQEQTPDADADAKKYLVVEGNRRAASIKQLLRDHGAGAVDLSEDVLNSLQSIPVVVLTANTDELHSYQRTLMAIRHVAGVREWGPYQQAKLVVEMYGEPGATLGSVAQKIGISSREVARRFRASKALQQMEDDEEFSEFAEPRLYAFFHEAVSQPKVREWLGFTDETYQAENEDARRIFFELLSPTEVDGEKRPAKLNNANQQVRQLKAIVGKDHALNVLADPTRSFEDAVKAAAEDEVEDDEGLVERSLAVAITNIKKPGLAYIGANERAQELWEQLKEEVGKIDKIITQ